MNATLFVNMSDNNVMDKNIRPMTEMNVNLKSSCSLLNPVLVIKAVDLSKVSECNYCYIPLFKRYYYINNIRMTSGGLAEIECTVDVLMSFKDKILACTAILQRHETIYNAYLTDNQFLVNNQTQYTYKVFPNGLSSPQMYFITI